MNCAEKLLEPTLFFNLYNKCNMWLILLHNTKHHYQALYQISES